MDGKEVATKRAYAVMDGFRRATRLIVYVLN
jgi:hypothetical protein